VNAPLSSTKVESLRTATTGAGAARPSPGMHRSPTVTNPGGARGRQNDATVPSCRGPRHTTSNSVTAWSTGGIGEGAQGSPCATRPKIHHAAPARSASTQRQHAAPASKPQTVQKRTLHANKSLHPQAKANSSAHMRERPNAHVRTDANALGAGCRLTATHYNAPVSRGQRGEGGRGGEGQPCCTPPP
jgi:hypothetical protein